MSSLDSPSTQREVNWYCHRLNARLENNPLVGHLIPLQKDSLELLDKVRDGLLIAAYLHSLPLGPPVDISLLNRVRMEDGHWVTLNTFQESENQTLTLKLVKEAGIKVVNVGETDLMNGRDHWRLVLGLLAQVVRLDMAEKLFNTIEAIDWGAQGRKKRRKTMSKMRAGSGMLDSLTWDLVKDAVNHILRSEGVNMVDHESLCDGRVLLQLLAQTNTAFEYSPGDDTPACVAKVVQYCGELGIGVSITSEDITQGKKELLLAVVVEVLEKWAKTRAFRELGEPAILEGGESLVGAHEEATSSPGAQRKRNPNLLAAKVGALTLAVFLAYSFRDNIGNLVLRLGRPQGSSRGSKQ